MLSAAFLSVGLLTLKIKIMEILFRAKTTFDNRFVYGCLIKKRFNSLADWMIEDDNGLGSDVITETIGQYVNLVDSANEKLFVGDLFKCETNDILYRIWAVEGGFAINTHVQIWQKDIKNDYPFPLQPLSDEQTVSWIKSSCIKVGNIYDNPELLEQP